MPNHSLPKNSALAFHHSSNNRILNTIQGTRNCNKIAHSFEFAFAAGNQSQMETITPRSLLG